MDDRCELCEGRGRVEQRDGREVDCDCAAGPKPAEEYGDEDLPEHRR